MRSIYRKPTFKPLGICFANVYGYPQIAMRSAKGALAQLGEHLLCKQGVIGSIPIRSTIHGFDR